MTPLLRPLLPYAATLCALLTAACATQQFALHSGDRIVFFGDSITQLGDQPKGYVALIRSSLVRTRPGAEVVNAGISGNKVTDLLQRLDRDVLAKRPAAVFIYIGINDVWHWALPNLRGTPPEQFESGLKEIISRIQAQGARVVLCTPSVIGEKRNGANPQDAELDRYAAISRRVAAGAGVELCDLRAAFVAYLGVNNPGDEEKGILTGDRVHLNDAGNKLVAEVLLKEIAHW